MAAAAPFPWLPKPPPCCGDEDGARGAGLKGGDESLSESTSSGGEDGIRGAGLKGDDELLPGFSDMINEQLDID